MEMSAESPRRPVAARPVRGPHGGWQKQEIEMLQRSIDEAASAGESLRSAFERVAAQLGRKPNSIRNFYYAQLRENGENTAQRPLPFETFSPGEVEQLIENVLGLALHEALNRESGESVSVTKEMFDRAEREVCAAIKRRTGFGA